MAAWPHGSDEMSLRIRETDWSGTVLGPIEHWPASFRTTVDLMLASGHAMQLAWGPQRIILYNDAYAPMLGDRHPAALGAPFRDAWPDIWTEIEPLVDRVFAGETLKFEEMPLLMTRHGYPEETWWNFSYSPVRDASGQIAGLLNVTMDATARHRLHETEAALGESEEVNRHLLAKQQFLLTLSDTLRNIEDPSQIKAAATRLLGQYLNVNRAFYANAHEGHWLVSRGYEQGVAPLPLQPFRMAEYGHWIIEDFMAGKAVVVHDMATDPRFDEAERDAHLALQVGAEIALPVVKSGRLVAMLVVHAAAPRAWTSLDVDLLQGTAERIWMAVERARMEVDLRRSEAKLRALFESVDEGFCTIQLLKNDEGVVNDYLMLEANSAFKKQTGLEDVIGKRGSQILPREEGWIDLFAEVASTGKATRLEYEVPQIGRWYSVFVAPMGQAGSQQLSFIFNDITERRRTDQVLRERDARQTFLLRLSDALRVADDEVALAQTAAEMVAEQLRLDRCYISTMSVAEDRADLIFEVRRPDLTPVPATLRLSDFPVAVGATLNDTLILNDVARDPRLSALDRQSLLAMSYGALLAIPIRRGVGNPIWCLAAVSAAAREWSGAEIELLETVAERTWAAMEQVRAEKALLAADRNKDQFLAVLAHELRNGLAPLVYNAQIAGRRPDDTALMQQLFSRSDRQLRHLVHLVDDLLDVARISTGKIELELALVKPQEIVKLAIENCRADIERKQHRLNIVSEDGDELLVRGDNVRLIQVVSNLLSNATKYMDDGGTIQVRLARAHDQVLIEVQDTGIGIPAAALPHVFELFSQVREQQAYSAGGLGIGLSLVKQLVEMQGGTVVARSAGPGQGSSFTLHLPAAVVEPSREPGHALSTEAAPRNAGLSVLVVDDNADAADALTELLTLMGHDAESAYGGAPALASVQRRRPDLVFLDLGMPGMDGLEVARRLRNDFPVEPRLHVIALTGRGQQADRDQTRAAAFDGHLDKPISDTDLEAVLLDASALSRAH